MEKISKPVKVAFALENIMGHVTHAQNLRRVTAERSDIAPHWVSLTREPSLGRLERVPLVRSSWVTRASLCAYRDLRTRARAYDCALFHTQACALGVPLLARRLPCVISMDCALYDVDEFHGTQNKPLTEWLKARVFSALFAQTVAMAPWSPWAARSLTQRFNVPESKIHVLPPGVDTARFCPDASKKPNDGVTRILFVGNDFARKGGLFLLQWAQESASAEARRARDLPPWELHIVSRDEIPAMPGVILHRNISNNSPELVAMYQRSDVFALPSYSDCHPWVLLEAMACGLPTLTTNAGGMPHMTGGESGPLLPVGNYEAVRDALDELLRDSQTRVARGEAARARALQHYNAERNYNRLLDLMVSVRRSSRRSRA